MQWKRIPFLLGALLLGGLVANWSWLLIRLDHLRHNGRTALATIDQTIEQSQHGSARSTRWVRYHFIPRDSETAVQGYDRIDWSMDESRQGALMTKPLQIKYLPEDPGFSRVAETVIDRVVSTRVAIVLTGTVAILVAGCGLLVGTSRRTALATWWSSRTAGP